ncbi:MAG: hypothetical protein ACYDBB_12640 [Armatimonadota bacterium]
MDAYIANTPGDAAWDTPAQETNGQQGHNVTATAAVTPLPVNLETIPDGLKAYPQFVVWKLVPPVEGKDKKPKKVPYNPKTGGKASVTTPSEWGTFDEATSAYNTGNYAGVGFVLTKAVGIVAFDLDNCWDPIAQCPTDAKAERAVKQLNSYTEVSPSGRGIRVLVRGKKTSGKCKAGHYEVYENRRYVTLTGQHVAGTPKTIENRQDELAEMETLLLGHSGNRKGHDNTVSVDVTNDYLSHLAPFPEDKVNALCAADYRFRQTWEYQRTDMKDNSASAHEMSLATSMALKDFTDAEILSALVEFRRKHGLPAKHAGALKTTITKALAFAPEGAQGHDSLSQDTVDGLVKEVETEYTRLAIKSEGLQAATEKIDAICAGLPDEGKRQVLEGVARLDGRRFKDVGTVADKRLAQLPPKPEDAIRNHTMRGKAITAYRLPDIIRDVFNMTDGWPKRVGSHLFADGSGENMRWLDSPEACMAWLHGKVTVRWKPGTAGDGTQLVSPTMLWEELKVRATKYDSVQPYPHYPNLPDAYYAWTAPADYTPDGHYLEGFLNYFPPETSLDRDLLRVTVCLLVYGSQPGGRPGILLVGPHGCGKTTFAQVAASLVGGATKVGTRDWASERIGPRFLSKDALTKYVVLTDNIKGQPDYCDILGDFITADVINGYRLYEGDGSRPNHLQYLLTSNDLVVPKDFADRLYIVHFQVPADKQPGWLGEVKRYVKDHQHKILADALSILQGDPLGLPPKLEERIPDVVEDVLRRCTTNPTGVLALLQDRRATICGEKGAVTHLRIALEGLYNHGEAKFVDPKHAFIQSSRLAEEYSRLQGKTMSTKAVTQYTLSLIEAGVLHGVEYTKRPDANGYLVTDEAFEVARHTAYDTVASSGLQTPYVLE